VPGLARSFGISNAQAYLLSQLRYLPPGLKVDFERGIVRIPKRGFSDRAIAGLKDRVSREAEMILGAPRSELIKAGRLGTKNYSGMGGNLWRKVLQSPFDESQFPYPHEVTNHLERLLDRPGHLWYSCKRERLREYGVRVVFA